MRTAMVVDDSRGVREILRRLLVLQGFKVQDCGTCADARALVAAHRFAFATVDLTLPDCDGIGLIQHIIDVSPTTKVLVATGRGTDTWVPAALEAGAVDVIYKPFEFSALLEGLRRAGLAQ